MFNILETQMKGVGCLLSPIYTSAMTKRPFWYGCRSKDIWNQVYLEAFENSSV